MGRTSHEPVGPRNEADGLRYGPNALWYGMLLVALAMVLVPPYLFSLLPGTPMSGTARIIAWGVWLLVMGSVLVRAPRSWTRFTVRRDGLEQRRIGHRRFRTWAQIGAVRGRAIDVEAARDGTDERSADLPKSLMLPVGHSTDPSAFYLVVYDVEGAEAFRIPPWVSHRRHLLAEIRQRSRAARVRCTEPGCTEPGQ